MKSRAFLFYTLSLLIFGNTSFVSHLTLKDCIVFHEIQELYPDFQSYKYIEDLFLVEQVFDNEQKLLVYRPRGEIQYLFDSKKTDGLQKIHFSSRSLKGLNGRVDFQISVFGNAENSKIVKLVESIIQMGHSVVLYREPNLIIFRLIGGVNINKSLESVSYFKNAVYQVLIKLFSTFKVDEETMVHIFDLLKLKDLDHKSKRTSCVIL